MPKQIKRSKKLTQKKKQRGGSFASDLVMQASRDSPVLNDYVAEPRIRDSNSSSCSSQYGGSRASDMVMSELNTNASTDQYVNGFDVKANSSSLKLYQTTGGMRKSKMRKSKMRKSKMHKSKMRKSKMRKSSKSNMKSSKKTYSNMKGGSDWISSQYSLGSVNSANLDTSDFSVSKGVSQSELMNPPTMGLAGSGYPMTSLEGAGVNMVGAPINF